MISDKVASEQAVLDRYGIVRIPADVFECHGYRYSNLRDAIAAAKRHEQKAPEQLGPLSQAT